ncbi:MAG TPA: LytTR family DNA-binding domain-containing protein [Cellvibrio sp.]
MNIMIVDDSRLARKELCGLLAEHAHYTIAGEAGDVQSAVALINELQPELLLLDIHLPDGSGFDLLEQCDYTPKVIFTTAYEQHALRAFEVNALDYLLKPVTQERLTTALEKIAPSKPVPQHTKIPTSLHNQHSPEHVFIREGERCHFVKFRDISRIAVEGNYARVFFHSQSALLPRSLNYVEERLEPNTFFRANRQEIINLNFIARIEPWIGDGLMIVMQDKTEIISSRRQARELKQRMEF